MYKKILFLFMIYINCYGQQSCVKILKVHEVKYYYVYKVLDIKTKDTVTLLSSKLDEEFKKILLSKNDFYEVETRIKSAIKISNDKYTFCKHGITIIEDIEISDKNKLPVLVLDFKKVSKCCVETTNSPDDRF